MKNVKYFAAVIILSFLVYSCKKVGTPSLTTNEVTCVTLKTATCGGNISDDGGAAIIARGVCWGTNQTPTVEENKTTDGAETGSFTSDISGLSENTTYYVRAYATNSVGTSYGETVSFMTQNYGPTVTDIDGNVYHTVHIGTQLWMVENLNVTHYRNGDQIPNVINNSAWSVLTTGARCYWNNDSASAAPVYGALYNWYTVDDNRNLCPIGWHIPSDSEWTVLFDYLGGETIAGFKLKSTSWIPGSGNNSSGFTAIAGGLRYNNGDYDGAGIHGLWWTATEYNAQSARYCYLTSLNSGAHSYATTKLAGHSVRCVKDF